MGSESVLRTSFTRGEAVGGLVWISIGALVSLLLEVVYLGARVDLPGVGNVPFPWTIVLAALLNAVFTKTARLWSRRTVVALVPLIVWTLGFLVFLALPDITGDQLLGSNIRTIVLLMAGVFGGLWPLARGR